MKHNTITPEQEIYKKRYEAAQTILLPKFNSIEKDVEICAVTSMLEFSDRENEKLLASNRELVEALGKSVSYFADLNGSDWFEASVGGRDMKQRAKGLQSILYKLHSKANQQLNK